MDERWEMVAQLLAPCLTAGPLADMRQGNEPRYLIREYYRLRRRTRALRWEHITFGDPTPTRPCRPAQPYGARYEPAATPKPTNPAGPSPCPRSPPTHSALSKNSKPQTAARPGARHSQQDLVFATRTGAALDAANVRRGFRPVCTAAKIGEDWTPRELRHSYVSLMSSSGVPVEEIVRLAGHSSSRTAEIVYRRELHPVLTTGAEIMDTIFKPQTTD